MTVYDFCFLCTDDSNEICIYDMNENVEDEVFNGTMDEAMYSDYSDCEVLSFDYYGGELCLNIETEN